MRSPNGCSSAGGADSELHKYRGVRKRKWGKWVSEVRLPNSRQRIWLGSYDAPEKAARAFDAAVFCLRSPSSRVAHLNFPDVVPQIPCPGRQLTHQQIRVAAAKHAHSEPPLQVATPPSPPIVSETEESEEVVLTDDWLFSGLEMDELWNDFVGSTMTAVGGDTMDGVVAEEGCSGFGTSSFLWNF